MTPLQELALLVGATATVATALGTWVRVWYDRRRDLRDSERLRSEVALKNTSQTKDLAAPGG